MTDNLRNEIGAHNGVQTVAAPDQSGDGDTQDVATSKSSRSPAFQFYPRDFLSSRKVDRMSMTERGIYITLLAHCWIDRGLPTDLTELAAACRMKVDQFERIWSRGVLSQCFEVRGDRFLNPRLEVERKAQIAYSLKQKEKAEKRWNANAGALPDAERGNAPIPSHPIPSLPIPKEKKDSDESHRDSSPVVYEFPTSGHPPTWNLHQSRIDRFTELFPGIDVVAEMRRALAWQETATKKKTARGMPAFLTRWLTTATDRPRSNTPVSGSAKTAGNLAALQAFAQRGRPAS